MEFFKTYFPNVNFEENRGETKVLCPFHHDTKPSATINVAKSLFHCYVCGSGYNEEQFMAEVKGIPVAQAFKLLSEMSSHSGGDWDVSFKAELWADDEILNTVINLGFTTEFIEEMGLGMANYYSRKDKNTYKTLAIPIWFDGVLMDIRKYNVMKYPNIDKMYSEDGAKSGWIVPYDMWKTSTNTTYIFEGEKDMLMARQVGLNAITLTGGAQAKPNEFCLNAFKDRDIIICYDNDDAGRTGAMKLAGEISKITRMVSILDIAQVVKEPKEDFYDYIHKYDGDAFEFMTLEVQPYIEHKEEKVYTKINQAMSDSTLKTTITSHVMITSEFVEAYSAPTVIQVTKMVSTKDTDVLDIGDTKYWTLDDNNAQEVLSLIEIDAKAKNIQQRAMELLKIPRNESGLEISYKAEKFIYRCTVMDKDPDGNAIPLDLYSFEKLIVGGHYEIDYSLYAHPNKNQRIVAITKRVLSMEDNSGFETDRNLLKNFVSEGTIAERIDRLYQSAKHHVAKHMDFNIWFMSDLVFSSILDFKYGDVMRGALDVFILGDTEVGKSETNELLVKLYRFGHFLSLKTSSTIGLIGGSNKVDGSWSNTIGAIPRQHKRLVVLEEFSGAKPDFIKTMTDVRSSNEIRLTRASGELRAPCKVRMITISNPINDDNGTPRNLSSFPNGVIPIMELVRSAEDVRRYDGFLLTPKVREHKNPFQYALISTPIDKEAYEHKAQWTYTRKVEDVVFEEGIESYIWQQAEKLNEQFECNVPIFGTTTSKKLARFCVALASLVMNTDSSYTKVIVTKEIVDYMVEFLTINYASDYFKLDRVKQEWDSFSKYTAQDVVIAEELYPSNSTMLEFLANQSKTTRANLQAISGKDRDGFSSVFNTLVRQKFVRINMESVYPTEKFRKIYPVMRKTTGEMISKHAKVDFDLGEENDI